MRVATVRHRLATRLQEALECGDVETVCRVTDYVRAVGSALAPRSGDDEVDLASLVVDSQQAAHILGYHPEHVRRLLRQEALEAEKKGNEYRIPLTSVIAALEGRVSGWVAPTVLKRLRALVPVWTSPEQGPWR
jgi:excisionase family DNA binding protein